jgi:hypothetical protein
MVEVNDFLEVTAGSLVMYAGESNSVPIDLFSSAELLDVQCASLPGEHIGNVVVQELAPQLATVSLQMSDSNTALSPSLPPRARRCKEHRTSRACNSRPCRISLLHLSR